MWEPQRQTCHGQCYDRCKLETAVSLGQVPCVTHETVFFSNRLSQGLSGRCCNVTGLQYITNELRTQILRKIYEKELYTECTIPHCHKKCIRDSPILLNVKQNLVNSRIPYLHQRRILVVHLYDSMAGRHHTLFECKYAK